MTRELLAYNGLVVGGLNFNKFNLLSWGVSEDFDTRTVRAAISIKTPYPDNFINIKKAFQEGSKSLGITNGTNKTIAVDIVTGSPSFTLTRTAGNSFDKNDLALPIEIVGVGMFQISKFIDSDNVECLVPPDASAPATQSGLTARIGESLVRCTDFSDSLEAADQTGTGDIGDKEGGFKARASFSRNADIDDDESRIRVECLWIFKRPALEVRPDNGNRTNATVSVSESSEGLATITFTGEITAGQVTGNAALVLRLLTESVDNWASTFLATYDSVSVFEEIGGKEDSFDEEGYILSFTRVFQQKVFGDLSTSTISAEYDDPRITGAQLIFARQYRNDHGLKKGRQPFLVSIQYSAGIRATGPNAVSASDHYNFWRKTIKKYLLERCEAFYGGKLAVIGGSDPVFDPFTSTMSASLTVLVSKSGSNVYSFNQLSSMELDENLDVSKLYDGVDFSNIIWSAGRALVGSVQVTVVQLGQPTPNQGGGGTGLVQGGVQGNINFFGNGFGLTGFFSDQQGSSDNSVKVYPRPEHPSTLFGESSIFAEGQWILGRRNARRDKKFLGNDPDGLGNTIQLTSTVFTSTWIWCRNVVDERGEEIIQIPNPGRLGDQTQSAGAIEGIDNFSF